MRNNSLLLLLTILLLSQSLSSQKFHYEKIYEGVYEGDTACLGPSTGFDVTAHIKSNSIVFTDLEDNDGKPEGYVPNSCYSPEGAGLLCQWIYDGNCWVPQSYNYGNIELDLGASCSMDSPTFVDISGDGFPDLLHGDVSNGGGKGGTIHYHEFNPVENRYELVTDTLWGIDFYDYSNIACDDFDGDGDPDCIVTNGFFTVSSIVNTGNGQWAEPVGIGGGANPSLGDLDNDGFPELLVSYRSWWPHNTKDIAVYECIVLGEDSIVWELAIEDYIPNKAYTHPKFLYHNEDDLPDLMVYENGKEVLLINTGTIDTANFSQESRFIFPFHLPASQYELFIEDINGNGKKEMLIFRNDNMTIYEDMGSGIESDWHSINNNIDTFFLSVPNPDSLFPSNDFSFADFTGDGLKDIIVRVNATSPHEDRFMLFENTSTNQFEYLQDSTLEAILNPRQPYILDIDNDNNLELLFKPSGDWQHYERNPLNNQWEIFSGINSFEEALPNFFSNVVPSFFDFDKDGKLDILTATGPGGHDALSFYRNIGKLDSMAFELQPRENYQPIGWEGREVGIGPIFFTNFDNQCGKDMILKSGCRGILIYGYRGITPEIIPPNDDNSFTSCDSSVVLEALPIGGSWEGMIEPDGTFQPIEIGVGQFEAIYTYTDPEGCYTFSDTLLLNVTECVVSSTEEVTNSSLRKFHIRPNPCKEKFEILLNQAQPNQVVITLTSALGGKSIKLFDDFETREEAVYQFTLPPEFQSGVYMVGISLNNEKIITRKLVKL